MSCSGMIFRRLLPLVILSSICLCGGASAQDSLFDLETITDPSKLEVEVLQDWKPSAKDPAIRQKLIEVTVCEWWPGQKVRLPVTLNAPAKGICRNIVIANQSPAKRVSAPRGETLKLLKEHGVGVVLIGMGTIDAMEPKGKLHIGMREQLLKTKNPRYTPAWIWGMSQMRALTAAMTEPEVFQPEKVLATGGSKRGVASAVAGIFDKRFTAIVPVVAPPLGNPGVDSYVIGTENPTLLATDEKFYKDLAAGKLGLELSVAKALQERAGRRADNRVTLEQARAANWSEAEIEAITDQVWQASRITDYLPALKKRGLEVFYNVGTNDSVTPALLELGNQFPDFPICIIPGGQHGGPATAGFTKRTPSTPEVTGNFYSFARHHFFGGRSMIAPPEIASSWNAATKSLSVAVTFPEGVEPQKNQLWWNLDRSEPYTLPFEYDVWNASPMEKVGSGKYESKVTLETVPERIDFLSLHTHTENELPLTISSPYQRHDFGKVTVALIGDSTVTDTAGWGKAFADRFKANVETLNFAAGGRSTKSWLAEKRMPAVLEAKPDFMLIQFGHNGQPGKGAHRETVPETTYRDYLRQYVNTAREIGATPILLSSVTRRDFTEEGKIRTEFTAAGRTRPLKPWAEAAKAVAAEMNVAFIDLYELSVAHHNKIGVEKSESYNPKEGDITHFNRGGAEAIADLIVEELKDVEKELAGYLK